MPAVLEGITVASLNVITRVRCLPSVLCRIVSLIAQGCYPRVRHQASTVPIIRCLRHPATAQPRTGVELPARLLHMPSGDTSLLPWLGFAESLRHGLRPGHRRGTPRARDFWAPGGRTGSHL